MVTRVTGQIVYSGWVVTTAVIGVSFKRSMLGLYFTLDAVERNSRHTQITEDEVNITGEKGQEIKDHHGLELVEDNKEKKEKKEKETDHILQAGNNFFLNDDS